MRNDGMKSPASRRNFLIAMAGVAPLVTLGSMSAEAKMAQTNVGYQTEPKDGKECDQCNFFVASPSRLDFAFSHRDQQRPTRNSSRRRPQRPDDRWY